MNEDAAAILSFGLVISALMFFQASFAWRRIAERDVLIGDPSPEELARRLGLKEAAEASRIAYVTAGVLALIALAALWA